MYNTPTECHSTYQSYDKALNGNSVNAGVAELADAPDLGSGGFPCRFDPCHPHQTGKIRTLSNQGSYFSLQVITLVFKSTADKRKSRNFIIRNYGISIWLYNPLGLINSLILCSGIVNVYSQYSSVTAVRLICLPPSIQISTSSLCGFIRTVTSLPGNENVG